MKPKTSNQRIASPDSTAVRVALWRALHVEADPQPHVFEDTIGLKLVAPDEGWRNRPDMSSPRYRASVVIRARFVEDLVIEQAGDGAGPCVDQYVILGAGLDTFAQRRPEIASRLQIFEIDRHGAQAWKSKRLMELGYGIPEWLHLVSVNFETDNWLGRLRAAGFDPARPSVVASTGVSMYLTKEAIASTLQHAATLAPGSTFAMTFLLPQDHIKRTKRSMPPKAEKTSRSSRKPFISFFSPEEMLTLAREAGFRQVRHISGTTLTQRYLANRMDSSPLPSAEEMLVATT